MAVGTLEAPAGFTMDNVPAEVLQFAGQLMARAKAHEHSPYRKALLARIEERRRKGLKKDPPASELPEGGYRVYRVMAGRHTRYDVDEQEKYRAHYRGQVDEARKNPHAPLPELGNPQEHVFSVGDLVTPQDDHEALMMDQDAFSPMPKKKFQLVGTAADQADDGVTDEVAAELSRLRTANQRTQAVEDENAKLRKELEDARKKAK